MQFRALHIYPYNRSSPLRNTPDMLAANPFSLIQDDEQFLQLCTALGAETHLAIDTEFVRESTYYPQFCLLQVASPQGTYCIDPLKLNSLAPLTTLLENPNVSLALHSARQDLEVLLQSTGRLPRQILDTQIAAALTGFHEQIGYAALVEEILGLSLSKEQTRTDWSRRPLTSAQLHYAADDVIYLSQILGALTEKLDKLGRKAWWIEDSSALLEPMFYNPPAEDAWKKVRGLFDLSPQALARAITVAQWREEAAQTLDIPRSWVLRDEALLCWAEQAKPPSEDLRIRNTPRPIQQALMDDLHFRLSNDGPIDFAVRLHQSTKGKTDPARKSLIKKLSEKNQARAKELGISPSVLATRKDLETLVDHPDRSRLLSGWRQEVIGNELRNAALNA